MSQSVGEFEAVVASLSESRPAPSAEARTLDRVAVLGAGPVGVALACECLAAGCRVALHSAFADELAALGDSVTVRGEHLVGSYRLSAAERREPHVAVRGGIDSAVRDADAVLIATPALAHATYAGLLAGVLRPDQIVALVPGRAFGAVEFARALRRGAGAAASPVVVELASAPYLVSAPEPGRLEIAAVKRSLTAAAFPNRATPSVVATLQRVLPMLRPAGGVLETTFGDLAGVLHVAPAVLSSAVPGAAGGALADRLPPALTGTVVRRLDEDRRRVAFAYGVRELPALVDWLAESYGAQSTDLDGALAEVEGYARVPVDPASPRVHDAVATSLVPLLSAGRVAGVPTPAVESLVGLASVLASLDYGRHGRTLEGLGLAPLGPEGIRRALDGGDAGLMAEVLA